MMNLRRNLLASELAGRLDQAVSDALADSNVKMAASYTIVNKACNMGVVQGFLDAFAQARCGRSVPCDVSCHEFASKFYAQERETIAELLLYAGSPSEED